MIKIENVETFGWESAIRGMRNPMNSWGLSDSYPAVDCGKCGKIEREGICKAEYRNCTGFECYAIGEKDLKLMQKLSKAGDDHGKFLRMINVTLDITAPLYWWKEFDTYKVGTVANSCSTMHTIHVKEFELDDFSNEHLIDSSVEEVVEEDWVDVSEEGVDGEGWDSIEFIKMTIRALNVYRNRYVETKDKKYWWQMIQLLPSSYNQKRTVQLNYQVLKSMYHSRKHHKLDEWVEFCKWCETLPYFKEICIQED